MGNYILDILYVKGLKIFSLTGICFKFEDGEGARRNCSLISYYTLAKY